MCDISFKFIEGKIILDCFYNVGAILCIFPWNPTLGKNFIQLTTSIILFSSTFITAYFYVKTIEDGIEFVIFSIIFVGINLCFHFINICDLIEGRKYYCKLLFYLDLDNIVNCTLVISKIRILCYATLSLSFLFFAVCTNLEFLIVSSFPKIFMGCYWTIQSMQMYVMTGFLMEISLFFKKREFIICKKLHTICRQSNLTNRQISYEIRMFKNNYKYLFSVVLSLNAAFGKKILVFIIQFLASLLLMIDYVFTEDVQSDVIIQSYCYIMLILVSFYCYI